LVSYTEISDVESLANSLTQMTRLKKLILNFS